MARPRAIFDCNVLVQAVLNPSGPGYACLRLLEEGRVELCLSLDAITEARKVLNRPFVRQRLPEITSERIDAFLSALAYRADLLREVPHVQAYPRDPKDEPYLDLAVAAGADYLVTNDGDLLALATAHSSEAKQFRQRTSNRIRILTPAEFLDELSAPPP
jgi:putative PIN family toxin of toxin-antitoxin system